MSNEGKDGSGSGVVHADPKLRRTVAVVLLVSLVGGWHLLRILEP